MDNICVNNDQNGNIKISDEVIATIVTVATKEVSGISGLSLSLTDEITSRFVKKNSTKAIKINNSDNVVSIDISIVVNYGIRIPDVAWEVQENVKKSVESMSGLIVDKINVIVSGINFETTDDCDNLTINDDDDSSENSPLA